MIKLSIGVYLIIQIALYLGYMNPTDKDYFVTTTGMDSIPKMPRYDSLFKKRDTTPYKGNWVDEN